MKENEPKNKVICILGMHRSGTSMISRILNICGLYLGEADEVMHEKLNDNEKGHWENKEILSINDAILTIFGGSWNNPPKFPENWENDQRLNELKIRAKVLVKSMNERSGVWGFKEPRTCLTLPFWKVIIPKMYYVIPFRSSIDVAWSLARRDNFSLSQGISLWLSYWGRILEYTRNESRIFTLQNNYFNDWKGEIRGVINFISEETISLDGKEDIIERFISPRLLHSRIIEKNEWNTSFFADILYDISRSVIEVGKVYENNLNEIIQNNDEKIQNLKKVYRERELEIINLNQTIQQKEQEIMIMRESKFWKLREYYLKLKNKMKF